MHPATIDFTRLHLTAERARGKTIVEVGALDVDGGCTAFRKHAMSVGAVKYIGLDMRGGANVDVVCRAEDMVGRFGAASIDGVLSVSTLEHVAHWQAAVNAIKAVVRPGGWVLLGAPGEGFPLHEFPADYWRFSVDDVRIMFADFEIVVLERDPQVGGFLLFAIKPEAWQPADISAIRPYSMVKVGGEAPWPGFSLDKYLSPTQ